MVLERQERKKRILIRKLLRGNEYTDYDDPYFINEDNDYLKTLNGSGNIFSNGRRRRREE